MSHTDHHREFVNRFLEGSLSDAEAAEFGRAVTGAPALADALARACRVDVCLDEHFSVQAQALDMAAAIGSRPAPRRTGFRRSSARWVAVAVLAVGALLGWAILRRRAPDAQPTGHSRRFVPSNVAPRPYPAPQASGRFTVSGSESVQRGAVLRTDAEQRAALTLGGYCRLDVEPESVVRVAGSPGRERIVLRQGRVVCDVEHGVGQFSVETKTCTVSAKGTRFSVELVGYEGEQSMLSKQVLVKVFAGAVLVTNSWGQDLVQAGERRVVPPAEVARGEDPDRHAAKAAAGERQRRAAEADEAARLKIAEAERKIRAAVAAGKITPEEGRAKMEAFMRGAADAGAKKPTREEMAAVAQKIKAAVAAGEMTEAEGRAKWEAYLKKVGAARAPAAEAPAEEEVEPLTVEEIKAALKGFRGLLVGELTSKNETGIELRIKAITLLRGCKALEPSLVLGQTAPILYATEENDEGEGVPVKKLVETVARIGQIPPFAFGGFGGEHGGGKLVMDWGAKGGVKWATRTLWLAKKVPDDNDLRLQIAAIQKALQGPGIRKELVAAKLTDEQVARTSGAMIRVVFMIRQGGAGVELDERLRDHFVNDIGLTAEQLKLVVEISRRVARRGAGLIVTARVLANDAGDLVMDRILPGAQSYAAWDGMDKVELHFGGKKGVWGKKGGKDDEPRERTADF